MNESVILKVFAAMVDFLLKEKYISLEDYFMGGAEIEANFAPLLAGYNPKNIQTAEANTKDISINSRNTPRVMLIIFLTRNPWLIPNAMPIAPPMRNVRVIGGYQGYPVIM
jgi:hypothetical protein